MNSPFKNKFAENIFKAKYSNGLSWEENSKVLVKEVCSGLMKVSEMKELEQMIISMKFLPAGRYLYYAGQKANFYNNCFCLGAKEDTREEWARLTSDTMACLMSGGGIGVEYSKFRASGEPLGKTGGIASGPIPLMNIMNEVGRNVMQGGSRRSALYAALNWSHKDIMQFIHIKNWSKEIRELKTKDFNFPAPLDMTNISVNYDDAFFEAIENNDVQAQAVWSANIKQMLKTAEPGMAFNVGKNSKDILRNACAEFTSEDDSDVCNLGSVNMGNIESIEELSNVSYLASKFLVCGGCRADLPYKRVRYVREENRKIGLGLMGVHEWMLKRRHKYEMTPDLKIWLGMWKDSGEYGANQMSDRLKINRPKKYRAIAPTGTIGILACTTTGIEPLYAVAYKRRYLTKGTTWNYEYVVDATTEKLIERYNLDPDAIETAASLANDPERRIKFQYELQKIVDMGISSTLNLPAFENQKFTPKEFSKIVLKYAKGLRGITVYPDGARGGQPLTEVSYKEAKAKIDEVHTECYIGCDTCGS